MSLHTWHRQVPRAKQLSHLHAQPLLGQSCHRQKKNLASIHAGSLRSCPTLCNPVVCSLPAFSGACRPTLVAIPYWSAILPAALAANPRVPGAARTPAAQAAAPPPHLALTGTSPSPPGQLQDDPSGRPTCRGGNKTTNETRGQCG